MIWIAFFCVVLLLAGCAAPVDPPAKVVAVQQRPGPVSSPILSSAEEAKAIAVTAEKLYMTYSRPTSPTGGNADQRYRNRLLLVSGTVEGVTRGVPGRVYLELGGGDGDGLVYAEPTPEALPEFMGLAMRPGQKVRLLCRGDSVAVGSPLLRQCLVR